LTVEKLITYALIQINEYNDALQYVRKIIKDAPTDITALNMGGYCHEMQNNYFDALKLYGHILSIDPEDANACNSMAYILSKTNGDLKEAIKFALKALKSNPENPAYCDTLGYICMKAKKYDKAEEYLIKALKHLPLSKDIREHLNELNRKKP
jgi:tetratricopeptide (TPR) repeat protein